MWNLRSIVKIVKGELTQSKQQLERLYSNSDKTGKQISFEEPFFDRTGFGFSMFRTIHEIKKPDLKTSKSVEEIDENTLEDPPKEEPPREKEESKQEESKQEESSKGMQREFKGRCFACNTIGHMKRDCTSKKFKPLNGHCYNCHSFGHRANECRRPKVIVNNYDRMIGNTNNADKKSIEEMNQRKVVVCFRCNKVGHIARNCRSQINQQGQRFGNNGIICQLCNKFGHLARFCRMNNGGYHHNPNPRNNARRNENAGNKEKGCCRNKDESTLR